MNDLILALCRALLLDESTTATFMKEQINLLLAASCCPSQKFLRQYIARLS